MRIESINEDAAPSVLFLHGGNVAGWMWEDQVAALPDHHCLVADLPGFGASADESWTTMAGVADELAAEIASRAHEGRAHVVGLSLGAVLGTVLVARHPAAVRSALLSGAPLQGMHGLARWVGLAQLRVWDKPWYWRAMARTYRIPDDAVEEFVRSGLAIRRVDMNRLVAEVYDGVREADLEGLGTASVPVLALAGEREPKVIRHALAALTSRSDAVIARLAPRMHHAWNTEDPGLFNDVMRTWLLDQQAEQRLLPA
jgi:pimeloyl-ACP methyl ester carboxylesterase